MISRVIVIEDLKINLDFTNQLMEKFFDSSNNKLKCAKSEEIYPKI